MDIDKQINKQAQTDLIEAQWDTIPFQILHSNHFENLLKLGKFEYQKKIFIPIFFLDSDPKKVVFNIWLGGSSITSEILSEEQSAIRQFEIDGNIDLISVLNVDKSYPSYELFQLLQASGSAPQF